MNTQRATPFFFPSEGRALFGWFHDANSASSIGMVICSPFGYEAICAHRSLRRLAETAAAAGIPSIRFDYLNTGDSADGDDGSSLFDTWVTNVHSAADTLRSVAKVESIVLIGLRLGGSIAAIASANRTDVAGFASIEPVVLGRTYLRELRALQSAFGSTSRDFTDLDASGEVLGFPLQEPFKNAVKQIDLGSGSVAPSSNVLVLSREGNKDAERWLEKMRSTVSNVIRFPATGYVEMMLDPHKAVVPEAMLAQITQWAGMLSQGQPSQSLSSQPPSKSAALVNTSLEKIQEEVVWIKDGIFGILTKPKDQSDSTLPRTSILLLNAGATHHIGPNRMYVHWARDWARKGHTVMRVDILGIGDSASKGNEPDDVVYPSHACDNIVSALTDMDRRCPGVPITIIGLCSGAFHALQAASRSDLVRKIVMINPLTYFWNYETGTGVGDLETSKRATQRISAPPVRRVSLSRIMNRARLKRVAKHAMTRSVQRADTVARDFCRLLRVPVKYDLQAVFRNLIRRKVKVSLIFSAGDPGLDLLFLQGGVQIRRLIRTKQLSVHRIAGADHTMTLTRKQFSLFDALDRQLAIPAESATRNE